jgi:hypothetical protein
MANRPWLEEVRTRLVENGLPPAYIRRFMEELADHFQDITEEIMSTETNVASRLGDPSQLAAAAIDGYRRHGFIGRHWWAAFFVFAVSPIVSLAMCFFLVCCGIVAFFGICEHLNVDTAIKNQLAGVEPAVLCWGMSALTVILPAVLLTILYGWFAKRSGIGRKWMLASCGALALLAMLPTQGVVFSDLPGNSRWMVGLSLPPTSILQSVQLMVPLIVGAWLMRTMKRRQETAQ